MNKIKMFTFFLFLVVGQMMYAQSNQEADSKVRNAVNLMDNGKIDESLVLLKEAIKLVPNNYTYQYELAYAYCLKQEFKKSIKILEKLKTHKDLNARLYQMLGNCYDYQGNSNKAFQVYDEGLAKFPKTGFLYLEKGNVHWNKKEYEKALPYYEQGIEIDPAFPSNYYRATLIYCNSKEEMWGMMYGEIFLNLEPNSKRTSEISKLLFDTYKSQIKIDSDTSMSVSFSQNMMTVNADGEMKMPFGLVYEPTLMLSIISTEKNINLSSLNQIRTNFINLYYEQKHHEKYPNALFDFQKKLIEAGHFETYNYWLLLHGDVKEFEKWYKNNEEKFKAFADWINENPLTLTNSNKFYKAQY